MGKIAHFLPVFARFVETAQKFNSTFVKIYRLQYWDTSAKIRTQRSTKQQAEKSAKMKKTITTKDTFGKTRSYEVVGKIPLGFFVWNIGENMGTDEYIPICEDLHPENKDNYEININTVKAIKLSVEEVKALREAATVGVNSKATAEKALKSKRRGYWSDRKRAEAEKTIDIFKRITA